MIVGMPRNTSAYTIASERSGANAPARELAHDRDDQRPDQHDRLGDDEQLDVPPEAAEQRGAAAPDQVPLEHDAADRGLVARKEERTARDDRRDQAEADHVEQVVAAVLGRGARVEGSPFAARGVAPGGCARPRARRTPEPRAPPTASSDLDGDRDLRPGIADLERLVEARGARPTRAA